MTQSAFAEHMGVDESRVRAWKKQGMLAYDEEGNISFDKSKALIEIGSGSPDRLGIFTGERRRLRERKDHYETENARLDYEQRCGNLTSAEGVKEAVAAAGSTLRILIESMPDALAPRLNGDEEQRRAILVEWTERYLNECAAAFRKMAKAKKR